MNTNPPFGPVSPIRHAVGVHLTPVAAMLATDRVDVVVVVAGLTVVGVLTTVVGGGTVVIGESVVGGGTVVVGATVVWADVRFAASRKQYRIPFDTKSAP